MKTRREIIFNARIIDYNDGNVVDQASSKEVAENIKDLLTPGIDGTVEITILNDEVTLLK